MDHNDSHISEVVNRTLVPLLVNYMPAVVTALVAWITLIQIYFGKKDKAAITDESKEFLIVFYFIYIFPHYHYFIFITFLFIF